MKITVVSKWDKGRLQWVVMVGTETAAICPTELDAQYNAALISRARDEWRKM